MPLDEKELQDLGLMEGLVALKKEPTKFERGQLRAWRRRAGQEEQKRIDAVLEFQAEPKEPASTEAFDRGAARAGDRKGARHAS